MRKLQKDEWDKFQEDLLKIINKAPARDFKHGEDSRKEAVKEVKKNIKRLKALEE